MLTTGIAVLAFLVGSALTALACRRTATRTGRLARLLHGSMRDTTATEPPAAAGNAAETEERFIEPKIEPETVAALLEDAKALADGEKERGASLRQRAGWVLGFLGVTLTILLTQAREFGRSDLGSIGKPLAAVLVLVALIFILGAALWALRTLAVVRVWHVGPEEAERYPSWAYIGKEPELARGKMLQGWVRQFAEERPANDQKAEELQRAFRSLTLGIGALAAVAVIVSARALGV